MEVILLVLFVGIVGGAVAASVTMVIAWHRRDVIAALASQRQEVDPPSINYSSLKVSGVGGLGLVAVCAAIAIALPEVRNGVLAGLVLGAAFAIALVFWRRRAPLPSSGARPGANTTLAIDAGQAGLDRSTDARPEGRLERHAFGSSGAY